MVNREKYLKYTGVPLNPESFKVWLNNLVAFLIQKHQVTPESMGIYAHFEAEAIIESK